MIQIMEKKQNRSKASPHREYKKKKKRCEEQRSTRRRRVRTTDGYLSFRDRAAGEGGKGRLDDVGKTGKGGGGTFRNWLRQEEVILMKRREQTTLFFVLFFLPGSGSDINKSIRHIHTSNVCSAEKCAGRRQQRRKTNGSGSGWNASAAADVLPTWALCVCVCVFVCARVAHRSPPRVRCATPRVCRVERLCTITLRRRADTSVCASRSTGCALCAPR